MEPATLNRLSQSQPYEVNLFMNSMPVSMKLDTGSPWTILSSATHEKLGQASQLEKTEVRLRTYNGTPVSIQGQAQIDRSQTRGGQAAKEFNRACGVKRGWPLRSRLDRRVTLRPGPIWPPARRVGGVTSAGGVITSQLIDFSYSVG